MKHDHKPEATARALLSWYDESARRLPWRTPPGAQARDGDARSDAYRVWLSEIMLQQTTVATVGPYFERFIARWPTVEALAAAPRDAVLAEWAGLGYYARARNLHACAQKVASELGGAFPSTEAELRTLPGVGPYTAAAIAAIAFGRKATPVDGNYDRVIARLYAIETPLPDAKPEIRARAEALTPDARPGDFAQAMMDLGATLCTPRNPACAICPWTAACEGRRAGLAGELPRKRPKTAKPTRLGAAFVAMDGQGRLLARRRPDKGLLGGMMGFPGTEWRDVAPESEEQHAARPRGGAWMLAPEEARHTFTHFHLRLAVHVAQIGRITPTEDEQLIARDALDRAALPTVMLKVAAIGLAALDAIKPARRDAM